MAVLPGEIYVKKVEKLVNWESGYTEHFAVEDEEMDNLAYPVVVVYNGIHHFCSSLVIDSAELENRRFNYVTQLVDNLTKLLRDFTFKSPVIDTQFEILRDYTDQCKTNLSLWKEGKAVIDYHNLQTRMDLDESVETFRPQVKTVYVQTDEKVYSPESGSTNVTGLRSSIGPETKQASNGSVLPKNGVAEKKEMNREKEVVRLPSNSDESKKSKNGIAVEPDAAVPFHSDELKLPPPTHTPPARRKYPKRLQKSNICEECDIAFPHRNDYDRHMQDTHNTHWYSCEYCPGDSDGNSKRFRSKSSLNLHVKGKHTAKKSDFICSICPNWYTRSFLKYAAHMLGYHAITDGSIRYHYCKYCLSPMTSRTAVLEHYKVCTKISQFKTPKKTHKCSKCPKTFSTAFFLLRHFKVIHTEYGKKYKCAIEECRKQLGTKSNYLIHMQRHADNDDMSNDSTEDEEQSATSSDDEDSNSSELNNTSTEKVTAQETIKAEEVSDDSDDEAGKSTHIFNSLEFWNLSDGIN